MPHIHTFSNNPLACNTYVYIEDHCALIVDSSVQSNEIIQLLRKNSISKVILAYTHGHFDHIAYGYVLQRLLKSIPIDYETLAPKREAIYFSEQQGLQILSSSLESFNVKDSYPDPKIPHIDTYLTEKESLRFLDFILIETPGHSPGSSCFYSADHAILFSGDTIFANGNRGRTDLPLSCETELWESLHKLSHYPTETNIFPGHGSQDKLGRSLKKLSIPY